IADMCHLFGKSKKFGMVDFLAGFLQERRIYIPKSASTGADLFLHTHHLGEVIVRFFNSDFGGPLPYSTGYHLHSADAYNKNRSKHIITSFLYGFFYRLFPIYRRRDIDRIVDMSPRG